MLIFGGYAHHVGKYSGLGAACATRGGSAVAGPRACYAGFAQAPKSMKKEKV